MVFQGSAKHEGHVASWHLIGLARGVQKEAELFSSALQGCKEYFATLVGNRYICIIMVLSCNSTFYLTKR